MFYISVLNHCGNCFVANWTTCEEDAGLYTIMISVLIYFKVTLQTSFFLYICKGTVTELSKLDNVTEQNGFCEVDVLVDRVYGCSITLVTNPARLLVFITNCHHSSILTL